MHIYCKTERAVLLLGVSDDNKVKYFPHSLDDVIPGIIFNVRPLESINVQLQELAATFVGKDVPVEVIQEYSDTMPVVGGPGSEATVYLATCSHPRAAIKGATINLPDLIRKTPSGRGRVILIKAMQIFAGALTEQSKAVDFDQAIRHFDK
jgi:hypothetical protein